MKQKQSRDDELSLYGGDEEKQETVVFRASEARSFFETNGILKKILGFLAFTMVCSFLLFRGAYLPKVSKGEIAKESVVAPIDCDFSTKDSLSSFEQNNIDSLGMIYKLPNGQIDLFSRTILNGHFADDTSQITDKYLEQANEDISQIKQLLKKIRFISVSSKETWSDVIKIEEVNNKFIFCVISSKPRSRLPAFVKSFAEQVLFNNEYLAKIAKDIISELENLDWKLVEDTELTHILHSHIKEQLPQEKLVLKKSQNIVTKNKEFAVFDVFVINSLRNKYFNLSHYLNMSSVIVSIIGSLFLVGLASCWLKVGYPLFFSSNRVMALLISIMGLGMFFYKCIELVWLTAPQSVSALFFCPLVLPLPLILTSVLAGSKIAFVMSAIFSVLTGIIYCGPDPVVFLLVNFITGVIAVRLGQKMRKRIDIFNVSFKILLFAVCVYLIQIAINFKISSYSIYDVIRCICGQAICMFITSTIALILIPVFESVFKIVTGMTLVEFMDPSHPLLKRLYTEAPGTYRHSMMVGSLAEAAANAIKGNGLFCRVVSQYHDVGKLIYPLFFIENVPCDFSIKLHNLFTFEESAQIITSHVANGVILAREYGLPTSFIEIIREHHANSYVHYFYSKRKQTLTESEIETLDKSIFQYQGPRPQTKESTIIMIADSFEAASRSLEIVNKDTLTSLLLKIIEGKIKEGLLSESELTFEELTIIKEVMIDTLLVAFHLRLKYPV